MAKEVDIRVKADTKQYEKATKRLVRNTRFMARKMDQSYKRVTKATVVLTGAISALAAGRGIGALSESFLTAARDTENFKTRLTVLLGSVEEGNRLFENMTEYASQVPHELNSIIESSVMLSGVMKGGVDQISQWMPLVGDLAAAHGLSIETTTEQISRMYSSGAGAADTFRDKGISAALGFQAKVAYSAEETRAMLIKAWKDPESKFRGATERMAKTWDGQMSMMKDLWFQFRKTVLVDAGGFDKMKGILSGLVKESSKWLKDNEELIKQKLPEYFDRLDTAIRSTATGLSWVAKHSDTFTTAMSKISKLHPMHIGAKRFKRIKELIDEVISKQREFEQRGQTVSGKVDPVIKKKKTGPGTGTDKLLFESEEEKNKKLLEAHNKRMAIVQESFWEIEGVRVQNAQAEQARVQQEYEAQVAADEKKVALTKRTAAIQLQVEEQNRRSRIAIATTSLNLISTLGRKSFKVQQGVEVGRAIVNTYAAATAALAAYPGPPGIALAALETSLGLANVAAIANAKEGKSSGSVSSGGATGTFSASPVTGAPILPTTPTETRGSIEINIQGDIIGNDAFVDDLVEKISTAVETRDVVLTATTATEAGALA